MREILADSCIPVYPQHASRPTVVLDVLQNPDNHFLYTGAVVKVIAVYDQLKARLKEVSISRSPTLEVFIDVIRNQPEIPIDSKIPSDSTEDSEIP